MAVGRGLGKGVPEPGEESGDGCKGCVRGGSGSRKAKRRGWRWRVAHAAHLRFRGYSRHGLS